MGEGESESAGETKEERQGGYGEHCKSEVVVISDRLCCCVLNPIHQNDGAELTKVPMKSSVLSDNCRSRIEWYLLRPETVVSSPHLLFVRLTLEDKTRSTPLSGERDHGIVESLPLFGERVNLHFAPSSRRTLPLEVRNGF